MPQGAYMSDSICERCELSRSCDSAVIGKSRARMIGCSRYKQKKRITNGDRIRAMSDAELADWLALKGCFHCDARTMCIDFPIGTCRAAIMEWLKQEVDE